MPRDELIPPPQPIPYGRPIGPVGDREQPQQRRRPMPRRKRPAEEDEPPRRPPDGNHRIDEYV